MFVLELFNCGLVECVVVIVNMILVILVGNIIRWIREILDIEGVELCGKFFI